MRLAYRSSLPPEIRRSLDACWKEGVMAQGASGIFDYYLIPYALVLGAGAREVGWLVAIPNLLAALFQPLAVNAVRFAGDRRRALLLGVGVQAAFLLPVAALAAFSFPGRIAVLIVLATIFRVLGSLLGPIWGSLVSNYLPGDQRGQYFGWRARMVGIAGLATIAVWGWVLSAFPTSAAALGFAALFLAASLFRFASLHYMTRMVETPLAAEPGSEFTFWMFLRRFRDSNFVKFIFYSAAITFGTQLAAPYFAMHMLENLGFGYLEYMAVQSAAAAAGLFAFPVWGRHADRVGNARLLKTTGLLLPLLPAAWIFARSAWELVAIELFSGFVWAGFNLAVTNFIFDAVSPPKRVRCLAYYNLINGVAIFAGASFGGYLAGHLPPVLGLRLYALFLLSAAMRLAAHLLLSRHFSEVREPTESVTSLRLLFSVLGLRPMSGRNMEPVLFPEIRPPRAPH